MSSLAGLTFNSKPMINALTLLASENVSAASSVAAAIELHIQTVRGGLCRLAEAPGALPVAYVGRMCSALPKPSCQGCT